MLKINKTYINTSSVKFTSTEQFAGKRFIATALMAVSFGALSLQAGFVLNANAVGPITSPISYSATPTPSASAPVTSPEVTPTPSPSAPVSYPEITPSPSASPSVPVTSPEVTPSPSASATPSATPTPEPSATPIPSASPYLKITYPNGGESFNVGDLVKVMWEQEGTDQCQIHDINDSDPHGGHLFSVNSVQSYFDWIVDVSGLTPGNSVSMRIYMACFNTTSGSGAYDWSNYFIVNNPSVAPSATPTPTPSAEPSVAPTPTSAPSSNETPSNNNSNSSNSGSTSAPSCNNEAPQATKIVSALTTGKNEITLNWEKAQGNVTHYALVYGLQKGKPLYGNPNVGNNLSSAVKGLAYGATYYFRVQAVNDCTPGAYSNEVAVKVGGKFVAPKNTKPAIAGKTTQNPKTVTEQPNLMPKITNNDVKPVNAGLAGKVFNFFKGLFN